MIDMLLWCVCLEKIDHWSFVRTIVARISLHIDAVGPEPLYFAACAAFKVLPILFHLLLYVYDKHLMSCPDSYVPRQTFRGQFTSTKCKFFHH